MTLKIRSQQLLLIIFLFVTPFVNAQTFNPFGQTLQIQTNFKSMEGKPSWLVVIRNMETGQILPYVFDIKNNDNFWVAFSAGRFYRVTISNLRFAPNVAIRNFCGLENGVIDGRSMFIRLSGTLTPDVSTSKCYVLSYKDMPFPIASSPSGS